VGILKKIFMMFVFFFVATGVFSILNVYGQSDKITVYYFHGAFRCQTCANMEKYAREVIETNFKEALSSGKLEFKTVNVEDPGNEHFVDDYKLYTKALIISMSTGAKEVKFKNLDKIWEFIHNRKKFMEYVTIELNDFMKDLK